MNTPAPRIGTYALLRELGRGGQGIVYLAEDSRLHRKVALKVLRLGISPAGDELLRFRREAEIASRIDRARRWPRVRFR